MSWHGKYFKGAMRQHKVNLRAEAELRDQDTRPGRRSTKRRAKREKGTPPASKGKAA